MARVRVRCDVASGQPARWQDARLIVVAGCGTGGGHAGTEIEI